MADGHGVLRAATRTPVMISYVGLFIDIGLFIGGERGFCVGYKMFAPEGRVGGCFLLKS